MLVLVSVELIVTEPVASLYATDVAPPPVNIPPTISSICSWTRLTAPLETEKSVALKENINPISNALDKVSQLGGYSFDWKDTHLEDRGGLDDMFVKKSDVGIIAQEVQKVLPEAVGKREDGTLGVRYELLVPLLVESIKELKKEIQSLKS